MHFSASNFFAPLFASISCSNGADYVFLWCYLGQFCFKLGANLAETYLHHFSAVVQIIHFYGAIWDEFALNLVLIMQKQHLLTVLFWTSFVSNINKILYISYPNSISSFFHANKVQVYCTFQQGEYILKLNNNNNVPK